MPKPAPAVADVDPHENGVPPTIAPVLANDTDSPPIAFPNASDAFTVGAGAMATPATVFDGPCTNATVANAAGEITKLELADDDTAPDVAVTV